MPSLCQALKNSKTNKTSFLLLDIHSLGGETDHLNSLAHPAPSCPRQHHLSRGIRQHPNLPLPLLWSSNPFPRGIFFKRQVETTVPPVHREWSVPTVPAGKASIRLEAPISSQALFEATSSLGEPEESLVLGVGSGKGKRASPWNA